MLMLGGKDYALHPPQPSTWAASTASGLGSNRHTNNGTGTMITTAANFTDIYPTTGTNTLHLQCTPPDTVSLLAPLFYPLPLPTLTALLPGLTTTNAHTMGDMPMNICQHRPPLPPYKISLFLGMTPGHLTIQSSRPRLTS
jgi:hypothetical protein